MFGSREERWNDASHHHRSHLSKTISSEKRVVTDKDTRRGCEYYCHIRSTPPEFSNVRRYD